MQPLRVQISKRTDGNAVLKCIRGDGSETWQKQHGVQGAFFPLHDLTHFAVESELGFSNAFYGLIASGWSIEETGTRGSAARLPEEALFAENVVGSLDRERASGTRWSAEEFNYALALHATSNGRAAPRALTDDELARVRKRRAELFERWRALPRGQTLELTFDVVHRHSERSEESVVELQILRRFAPRDDKRR